MLVLLYTHLWFWNTDVQSGTNLPFWNLESLHVRLPTWVLKVLFHTLQRHRHMWTFQLFLFKRFDWSNFAELKSETQRDALCVTASRVSQRGCCLSYSACYFLIQSISAKTYCSLLDTQYVRTQLNKVWDNEVIQWQRNWNGFGGWGSVLNNAEKSVIT